MKWNLNYLNEMFHFEWIIIIVVTNWYKFPMIMKCIAEHWLWNNIKSIRNLNMILNLFRY